MNNNIVTDTDEKEVQFEEELFVNREDEQKVFIDTVRTETEQVYLEFNGVAGQGKSEFLKWIYYNAKEKGYFSVYIDFEDAKYHRPEIYLILETIADQLSAQVSLSPFQTFTRKLSSYGEQLRQFHLDSWTAPQSADRRPLKDVEDALITEFNNGLQSVLQQQKKVVFCLDSTEKAYEPAFRSFEELVLKCYTRHPNFMLVTAGQEELVWKNYEIRNRVKKYDLPCLDHEGVREQVEKLAGKEGFTIQDNDVVIDKILNLTGGHPFSNYRLVNFLTGDFKESLDKTVVETQFGSSIQELIKQVIENRILEKFQLSDEFPPVKDILWYLAPLRHIELSMLQYVLTAFLENRFKDKPIFFFSKLMGEFQKTYIFTRWQFGKGFNLDPVVRNLFLWDMRLNDRETFLKVQKALAEKYKELIIKTDGVSRIKNIAERLYHSAIVLSEEESQKNCISNVSRELKEYLKTYFIQERFEDEVMLYEQLDQLYNALESDKEDKELKNYSIDTLHFASLVERHKNKLYKEKGKENR